MGDAASSSPLEGDTGTKKRNLIILTAVVPVVLLFALLGWAVARTGGNPGGLGINTKFGEIAIAQGAAPEFAKESLDGEIISLSGLGGKVVMLEFWSSWCPPCRQEAPTLARVYREYEGENVEFIGLAIWDDPRKVNNHIEEFGLPYPNLLDDRGQIAIDYGVRGIPEKFFVDADGNLAQKFIGPMSEADLRAALDRLLAP